MASRLRAEGFDAPPSPTLNVARSPSHESFATDISLMSLSSLGSERLCRRLLPPRRPEVVPEEPTGLVKCFSTSDLGLALERPARGPYSEPPRAPTSGGLSWRDSEGTYTVVPSGGATWEASQLPSPHSAPDTLPLTAVDLIRSINRKVRQMYIRRRMAVTYRALERLACSSPPQSPSRALCFRDIERDKGRPLSKYDRNMMIFTWLQNLDETGFESTAS